MQLSSWTRPIGGLAAMTLIQQALAADVSECKIAADPSVQLSAGFGNDGNCATSVGTLSAFMLFVDFPDQPATEHSPESLRDFFVPTAADWYKTSSYGALDLSVLADTTQFYRMPAAAADYNWQRGFSAEAHLKYIQDALDAYDGDEIREVDVLYVVPTSSAVDISYSTTYLSNITTRGGQFVARKAVTFGVDGYQTWGPLVLNHETGHAMCLPDYYPFSGGSNGLYVGGWSLMGLISGPSPDYFSWDKWRLGWIADEQVDCVVAGAESGETSHVLTPLEVADGKKSLVVKLNETDVLVAEVRTAQGLDADTCSPGVLLYTVSAATATGQGPVRVLDATPCTTGCRGEKLNDAPLTLDGYASYTVGDGIQVTFAAVDGDNYEVKVYVP